MTYSRITRAAFTSRPSVGSSRKRMSGSVTKPRIMFIFCLWPVDSMRTFASRLSHRPKTCISSSIRALETLLGTPSNWENIQMFSRAVSRPYPDVSPPETMLIRWRIGNGSFATSWPATNACPAVGRSRVARILMSVVLPAPFGPSMPKSSPSLMPNDTPSRAVTGPSESSLPFGRALRRNRRFFPAKIRVRSRVSTAYVMGDCVRSPDPGREAARLGGDPLPVAGDVPGDPVAHQDASHVGEFGDLRLVVVEVVRELVRIELRQLNRDSLDVRRPDVAQRLAPRSRSGGRSKGSVLDKAS